MTSQDIWCISIQEMHTWLGRSVRAVLSDTPPGPAGMVGTVVGTNGPGQFVRQCNLSVACICCRAYDPACSAASCCPDSAAGSIPVESILVPIHSFVVVRPCDRFGRTLRGHELRQEHESASAVVP